MSTNQQKPAKITKAERQQALAARFSGNVVALAQCKGDQFVVSSCLFIGAIEYLIEADLEITPTRLVEALERALPKNSTPTPRA